MELYLIRHGETEWSLNGRHTSRTELTLTPHGEDEARALGARLKGIAFDTILSSPRQRAQQTCALAGVGTPTVDDAFAEWDYGDYEGIRSPEILAQRPDWDIYAHGCPHGESPLQITARADHAIAKLRQMSGRVAVFSHGHFGRVLGVRWIGLHLGQARHFTLGTASYCILGQHGTDISRAVIKHWNLGPGV